MPRTLSLHREVVSCARRQKVARALPLLSMISYDEVSVPKSAFEGALEFAIAGNK